ncbi:hypothetical protein GCM10020295_60970 [Streptomyces cinereospinus]
MDLLDVLLALVILVYAGTGYRRGLVAGCVSLAGFVGGAVLGVWLLPWVRELVSPGTTAATVTAVLTVLGPAVVGHALAGRRPGGCGGSWPGGRSGWPTGSAGRRPTRSPRWSWRGWPRACWPPPRRR